MHCGQIERLRTTFSRRWPTDFGIVDIARCFGRETETIHLNFQVGLKAHLEERGGPRRPYNCCSTTCWTCSQTSGT
jgi:hypothetical protein